MTILDRKRPADRAAEREHLHGGGKNSVTSKQRIWRNEHTAHVLAGTQKHRQTKFPKDSKIVSLPTGQKSSPLIIFEIGAVYTCYFAYESAHNFGDHFLQNVVIEFISDWLFLKCVAVVIGLGLPLGSNYICFYFCFRCVSSQPWLTCFRICLDKYQKVFFCTYTNKCLSTATFRVTI
jgi:hypothetical protein